METGSDRNSAGHLPVMTGEVVEFLQPRPGQVILDCTLGEGGHALRLLPLLAPGGFLLGLDRDDSAPAVAEQKLAGYGELLRIERANYTELEEALGRAGIESVDGVLFDLGVNSSQLDNADRGFSFQNDGPLDMRMDTAAGQTAADLVNRSNRKDLEWLIREYGEERFAGRISRRIVEERGKNPIRTTGRLAKIISRAVPGRGKIHPATRTFQALRLEVNQELDCLNRALPLAREILRPGGRICLIAFHSLEDRIVKHTFRRWAGEEKVKILTRKPVRPREEEVRTNPRSRSARLRAAEKI
ncbi:MAG: 16S rRNA (cytosine(1402)-N(4))-methyltransferase RsmH [Candidatus Erginobacter occultus]|nr:16S rRNA (cytosine(1402)-N(4))-methyltransferase RsmH [Candidatus Erginobacter occultus]